MSLEVKTVSMLVIEVMGRPKEHLVETLENLAKQISEEKGVKVNEKKIHEPALVKDQKDLFSSFMEIEVELDDPLILAILMFKYMPAHIEILEPEKLTIPNHGFADILNELTRRLHRYDEIARVMQMEKQILENQIRNLTSNKLSGDKKSETKK